jgi:hypothetical protein
LHLPKVTLPHLPFTQSKNVFSAQKSYWQGIGQNIRQFEIQAYRPRLSQLERFHV